MVVKTELSSGVRVLLEPIKNVRSVSIGIWMLVGSKNERQHESGIAHFTEHMLFKGTKRRTVDMISQEINELGGEINAWTAQEAISLYGKVIDEQSYQMMDLLSDLMFCSKFSPVEIERERKVVIEEICMYNDSPEEMIFDIFIETMWKNNPVGNPVLGSVSTVEKFNRKSLNEFAKREFSPSRIVISAAGNLNTKDFLNYIEKTVNRDLSYNAVIPEDDFQPVPRHSVYLKSAKQLDQIHFCIGTDAGKRNTEDRYALSLMNLILGGSSGSRIFKEIREKRGWAYSVGSTLLLFKECGLFCVQGGMQKQHFSNSLEIILREVRKMMRKEVTDAELETAKKQMKASILLGLENTKSRMTRIGDMEIFLGKQIPVNETIKKIESITKKDILEISQKYLKDKPLTLSAIGPLDKSGFEKYKTEKL